MYKALYMLVECYVKQRAADNTYDYIYQLDDDVAAEETDADNGTMMKRRPGYESTYVTPVLETEGDREGGESAQVYNPNDVVRVDIHEGASVESNTHVVESFYVDEVEANSETALQPK